MRKRAIGETVGAIERRRVVVQLAAAAAASVGEGVARDADDVHSTSFTPAHAARSRARAAESLLVACFFTL